MSSMFNMPIICGVILFGLFGCGGSSNNVDSTQQPDSGNSVKGEVERPNSISDNDERLLFAIDWRNQDIGLYTTERLNKDFNIKDGWSEGIEEGRAEIMEESEKQTSSERFLRIHYPINKFSPQRSGISFRAWLPVQTTTQETCVSFLSRFKQGFEFSSMGKLGAGLAAGVEATGGKAANGNNGFSGRLEWQTSTNSGTGAGRLAALVYSYGTESPSAKYYSQKSNDSLFIFKSNRWYNLEMCLKENSFSESGEAMPNGQVKTYIDGELKQIKDGLIFKLEPELMVDQLLFTTFFGGNSEKYKADRNEHIDYADLKVTSASITAR